MKQKTVKKYKIIGVIPARYGSTRLPGKALADINGKPMIQRVYEQSMKSKLLDKVIVATDDKRIFNAVLSFGGKVVMTSKRHRSGTDRIGEIAKWRNGELANCNIVVNIQGDEPFINPKNIDEAIEPLIKDESVNVSTLAIRITKKEEIHDPNIVKVVIDKNGDALYFSRNPVPFNRDSSDNVKYFKHIGLYVYRKTYLEKLIKIKPTSLELAEKLEQLRILETGGKIRVVITNKDSHSVDTKKDLMKIRKIKHG